MFRDYGLRFPWREQQAARCQVWKPAASVDLDRILPLCKIVVDPLIGLELVSWVDSGQNRGPCTVNSHGT